MTHAMRLGALTLAIVLGGLSPAEARNGHGIRGIEFEALDADGDGRITEDEMAARHAARFDVDADGDGRVTAAEIEARITSRAAERAARMVARMDRNDDGVLGPEELQPRRGGGRIFARIDADDDGAISRAEFDAARARMEEWRGKRHGD